MGEKRPILCLLNTGEQCDKCDVCGLFNKRFIQKRNLKDCVYDDYNKQNYNLDMVVVKLNELSDENEQLRQIIKENVFQQYREGSLTDLKFKAIAYDDIVKLEMSYESEPKVIVICKQGKKENVKSFCQLFIPFGVCYEIKEVIDDE